MEITIPHIRIPFVDENNRLTQPAYQFLFFLWERSGATSGDIIDATTAPVVVISVNITTTKSQRIVCTAPLTIALNPTPVDGEYVEIKRTNGQVIIDGNGTNIDNDAQLILAVDFVGVQLFYAIDINTWVIV